MDLHELYVAQALQEPLDLEEFLRKLTRGELVARTAWTLEELSDFLDRSEQETLENIQLKAGEGESWAARAQEAAEAATARFAELRRRYVDEAD